MIDTAEDRHKFSSVLDKIGVDQPEWTEVSSVEDAKVFAKRVGSVALSICPPRNLTVLQLPGAHPSLVCSFRGCNECGV